MDFNSAIPADILVRRKIWSEYPINNSTIGVFGPLRFSR